MTVIGLRGRLTGHFLGRVFLLLVVLAFVFMAWITIVVVSLLQPGGGGRATPPTTLLRDAAVDTTFTANGFVLADRSRKRLAEQGMWLQVLDESGEVVGSADAPARLPGRYTAGRLVHIRQKPAELGAQQVFTWYETVGGRELTYLLGKDGESPKPPYLSFGTYGAQPSRTSTLALMAGFLLAGAVATLLVAWFTGATLARPLVHMMEWLRALAGGDYAEPAGRDGRAASIGRAGGLRRPYRTYREVFEALGTLTERMRRSEQERERLERAREEWMSGVSHDLRTPLSSVRGYAEVLASDYDFEPAEVRRQAALIRGQAEHMDSLLDDLNLTFRLSADALPLVPGRVDLVELAREAAVELANDPRASGREIVFEEPAGTGEIAADVDPQWFRRALGNLLVNAAVHNDEGTTVRVTVAREGAEAVVAITDDGRGMDAETMSRLFDRYYRGGATGDRAEGSGLGMAIARQLVEANGGRIEVESSAGAGTMVRVTVPAREHAHP